MVHPQSNAFPFFDSGLQQQRYQDERPVVRTIPIGSRPHGARRRQHPPGFREREDFRQRTLDQTLDHRRGRIGGENAPFG